MASLNKLSICGIRSFGNGPEDVQSLAFNKPLTLILGDNGCGKSTIIECLRYITAQKEPSGKGVFVHDPNLTSSSTVKAFVKLKLTDIKGEPIHLSKVLQATRARKTISTKNLDSSISTYDPVKKEFISLSNRCADFNDEVIRKLGVSKAILENVIFCTQEDAHWPLDTDQKLKEKFDQIFDSEKYNKCLKKVRDKRKELLNEKREREIELKRLRENKETASRKRNEAKDLEDSVMNLETEMEEHNANLSPIKTKLENLEEQEKEISMIHTAREKKKTEYNVIEKVISDLQTKIRSACCEFKGNDDDLESALRDCDIQSRSVAELKNELSELKLNEASETKILSQLQGKQGQLNTEIEINNKKINEKDKKIQALGSVCGINTSDISLGDIEKKIESRKNEISVMLSKFEKEEETFQLKIENARDDIGNKENDVKRKKESLEEIIKESNDLKKELENLESSQIRRQKVAEELLEAEKAISLHQELNSSGQLTEAVQRSQREVVETESKLNGAEEEVKNLVKYSEVGNRVEQLKVDYTRKTSELRRLTNTHRESLIDLLGKFPESNIKNALQICSEELNKQISDYRKRKSSMENEITSCRTESNSISKILQKKIVELQAFTKEVNSITGGAELNATAKMIEENYNEIQNRKGTLEASKYMYNSYITQLERSKPCCPLCHRDFAAEDEVQTLIDDLKSKMRLVPQKSESTQEELKEEHEKLSKLIALQSQNEKMEKIKNDEIPSLTKEQENKTQAVTSLMQKLDDISKLLIKAERESDLCTSLFGDMALLDQVMIDESKIKSEIEKLEKDLPAGWSKTLLSEAEKRRNNFQIIRKRKSELQEDAQKSLALYNEKLMKLQTIKHGFAEEELHLRGQGGGRKQQEDRLMTLKKLESSLRVEVEKTLSSVSPLQEIYAGLLSKFKKLKESHKNSISSNQREFDSLLQKLNDIRRLENEIKEVEHKNLDEKLSNVKIEIKKVDENIKSTKVQIESVNSKLGDMSKTIVRRRELEDNKTLRKKIKETELLKEELKDLSTKFANIGFDSLMREKRKLKSEEEKIGQRKAEISGRKGAIKAQVDVLKKELNSSMFRDIDVKFREELCEMKIAENLATDLLRYATAMDFAMSKYHKQQMEKVNSIVREYWRKIYRGNDVDYIEIYTDEAEVTEQRRSFNYKLVQIKRDAVLDMRNRCSAGQKMLASLIIRMALSEVFSNNCGILTLDEPTTNLDRKNIRNLATALNELIISKQNLLNSNFQLIVITHDKEFLDELVAVNAIDTFIEVSRNREGKSELSVHRVRP